MHIGSGRKEKRREEDQKSRERMQIIVELAKYFRSEVSIPKEFIEEVNLEEFLSPFKVAKVSIPSRLQYNRFL